MSHRIERPRTLRIRTALRRAAIIAAATSAMALAAVGAVALGQHPTRGDVYAPGEAPAGVSAAASWGSWIAFDSGLEARLDRPVQGEDGLWRVAAAIRNPGVEPASFAGVGIEVPDGAQRVYDDISPMQVGNVDPGSERTWSAAFSWNGDGTPEVGIRPNPVQDLTVRFAG